MATSNKFTIYEPQIRSSKKITDYFCSTENPKKWVTLIAQMQSGKTGTYSLTIFEMFRLGKIENAFIICGASDLALKSQVQNDLNDFVRKYVMYLSKITDLDETTRNDLTSSFRDNIQIIWGSELQSASKTSNLKNPYQHLLPKKTLFVWDESHYAQSDGNRMDGFLTSLGISPSGEGLSLMDTYFLSVSATPMSECSDIVHLKQSKGVVSLETSDSYYGVKEMLDNNKIIGYDVNNFKNTLETAISDLVIPDGTKCYAVVRISGSTNSKEKSNGVKKGDSITRKNKSSIDSAHMKQVLEVAKKMGWDVKLCDSSKSSTIEISDLKRQPTHANTIVIIKGKCRMGEVVDKSYILFGMETSTNANTDTILQSLIGRCCGYQPNYSTTLYIPDKIKKSGELERYVEFIEHLQTNNEVGVLPKKAMNIVSELTKNKTPLKPIIPLKVSIDKESINYKSIDSKKKNKISGNDIQNEVEHAFRDEVGIENHNSIEVYNRIRESITNKKNVNVRIITKTTKSYKRFTKNLKIVLESKEPRNLGSPNCTTIWVFGDDSFDGDGFTKYDVFVDSPIPIKSSTDETDIGKKIPKTTKREIFRHTLQTKDEIFINGGMLIGLHPDTLHNKNCLKIALGNLILHSLKFDSFQVEGLVYHRRINSVINQTSGNAGIWITIEIYDALCIGGDIYNEMLEHYGVSLKIIRDLTSTINIPELIKLNEISW